MLPISRLSKHDIDELRVRTHLRLGQWQQSQAEEMLQARGDMTAAKYTDIFAPGMTSVRALPRLSPTIQ